MSEVSKQLILPPIGKHISELQDQLKDSLKQHKKELYRNYVDLKRKRQRELAQLNKYKTLQRKVFNSQNKHFGGILDRERDIFLCKEPLIDDYLKSHIIDPQRNLEKGMIEIKTGTKEQADGSCFGDIPLSKLGEKERSFKQYWIEENKRMAQNRYKALLDSQTGIQKKINQTQRLKELKIFVPNKILPGYFEEHPSQILALTQLHQHGRTTNWKPNSFYGEVFENSFCSQPQYNNSILKEVAKEEQLEQ